MVSLDRAGPNSGFSWARNAINQLKMDKEDINVHVCPWKTTLQQTALHNFVLQSSVMRVISYCLAKANSDISHDTTDFSILQ